MKSKPIVMEHFSTVHTSFVLDFEFTNNNVVYSGSMQGVYTDGEVQLMLLITPGKMPFVIGVNMSLNKK